MWHYFTIVSDYVCPPDLKRTCIRDSPIILRYLCLSGGGEESDVELRLFHHEGVGRVIKSGTVYVFFLFVCLS